LGGLRRAEHDRVLSGSDVSFRDWDHDLAKAVSLRHPRLPHSLAVDVHDQRARRVGLGAKPKLHGLLRFGRKVQTRGLAERRHARITFTALTLPTAVPIADRVFEAGGGAEVDEQARRIIDVREVQQREEVLVGSRAVRRRSDSGSRRGRGARWSFGSFGLCPIFATRESLQAENENKH
jgi:hypothetical protein